LQEPAHEVHIDFGHGVILARVVAVMGKGLRDYGAGRERHCSNKRC